MHLRRISEDFSYEVSIPGKEIVSITTNENSAKGYVIASNSQAIELDFRCFQTAPTAVAPDLIIELYIDGVLRNVVKPRTGRGMPIGQFAEAKVDRGLILTKNGLPIMKKFRFIDLDLDEFIFSSRLVKNAGEIIIKVVDAGAIHDPFEDDSSFELPSLLNDRGCVTLLEGEINNTVGIRFDDGESSMSDTKYVTLQQSYHAMLARHNSTLGRVLADFTFVYGSDDLLNQLGVIPSGHKLYGHQIGDKKRANDNGIGHRNDEKWLKKSLHQSDYTFVGMAIEDRYEPTPCVLPTVSIVVVHEWNGNKKRAQESSNDLPITPRKRKYSSQMPCRVGKQPSTSSKSHIRPGMVRDRGLFTPTSSRKSPITQLSTPSPRKGKCIGDFGMRTPPPTLRTSPHSPPSSPKMRKISSSSPTAQRLMVANFRNKMAKTATAEDPFGGLFSAMDLERRGHY